MKNKYIRLWHGQEIEETDTEFQNKIVPCNTIMLETLKDKGIKAILENQIGSQTFLFSCELNREPFNLIVVNVKNSGLKQDPYRKRVQISKQIKFNNINPVYCLAAYDAGNKILYFFIEISDFLKSAQKGSSYSSLWIDFYQMEKTYEKDLNFWEDGGKRMVLGISNKKLKTIESDQLYKYLEEIKNENNVASTNTLGDEKETLVVFNEQYHSRNQKLLPRNSKLRNLAFEKANYTCELCGKSQTFITPREDQYFEAHHLIMYNFNVQKRYKYCLDNIENIVCLCPTCHKKIHYSTVEEKKEAVLQLLTKHNKLLQIFEIEDIQPILNDYIKGVTEDE